MPLKNLFLFLFACPAFISCNSTVNKIFGSKKTPHEAYADKVDNNPAGKQWMDVSKNVLDAPQAIKLPYSLLGYFPSGKPRALALQFIAKRGERINFDLLKTTGAGYVLYADVFKQDGTGPVHILSADTASSFFEFDAEETGEYILRLQPEMNHTAEYRLSVSVSPSLGFPVAGSKARVGSVWGDSRDGGERSHEGIDIFAAKLTPVIAAADGYISRVNDGGLGGKTVNLKVADRNLSLYYAHLDKQLVQEGQQVKKGDTLGLVGNTGNAKNTPAHLHFGIYSFGGAIDPLPFVNKIVKTAPAPVAKNLTRQISLTRAIKNKANETVNANTILIPLALTAEGYIAELPDGSIIFTPLTSVKAVKV
ncbi:MAG: M23 family metallopeptidase [Ferruginibacter sp.]|nr:M23 family metallopeptidase [Chitinophagaceae bacterium]